MADGIDGDVLEAACQSFVDVDSIEHRAGSLRGIVAPKCRFELGMLVDGRVRQVEQPRDAGVPGGVAKIGVGDIDPGVDDPHDRPFTGALGGGPRRAESLTVIEGAVQGRGPIEHRMKGGPIE